MQGIKSAFEHWLNHGGNRVGEVAIRRGAQGGFILTHWEEANATDGTAPLTLYNTPEDARMLAVDDDAGCYRPLKTAPNLRHGWQLELATLEELVLALDFLYPAMIGLWVAHRAHRLKAVALRETLDRQTGMYAVTKKITNEAADTLVGEACKSNGGCLKTILWPIDCGHQGEGQRAPVPIASLPPSEADPAFDQLTACGKAIPSGTVALPLFCQEACNLLVAAAREVVKKAQ